VSSVGWMTRVGRLTLVSSLAVAAVAGAPTSDDLIGPGLSVPKRRALAGDELRAILHRADQTQGTLAQFCAVFDLRVTVDLAQIDRGQPVPAALTERAGTVAGKMTWVRNRAAQRVEVTFDLAEDLKRYEFEDELCVDDGDMQIKYFPRTRQSSITRSGDLGCRTPADWLLPGFRREFGRLVSDPRFTIDGFESEGEDVLVRVGMSTGAPTPLVVDCLLCADLDYAVTAWGSPGSGQYSNVKYRRDEDGRVIPVEATQSIFRPGQTKPLREDTLRVESVSIGPPDPASLRFEFKSGTLVADNRPGNPDDAKMYRIDKLGGFEAIQGPRVKPPRSSFETFGFAGAGVVAILGVLALRARAAYRSGRGSMAG
jgi:hypothetical protein